MRWRGADVGMGQSCNALDKVLKVVCLVGVSNAVAVGWNACLSAPSVIIRCNGQTDVGRQTATDHRKTTVRVRNRFRNTFPLPDVAVPETRHGGKDGSGCDSVNNVVCKHSHELKLWAIKDVLLNKMNENSWGMRPMRSEMAPFSLQSE